MQPNRIVLNNMVETLLPKAMIIYQEIIAFLRGIIFFFYPKAIA
jgi:hypothetical protein